jgi:hypothetical protein
MAVGLDRPESGVDALGPVVQAFQNSVDQIVESQRQQTAAMQSLLGDTAPQSVRSRSAALGSLKASVGPQQSWDNLAGMTSSVRSAGRQVLGLRGWDASSGLDPQARAGQPVQTGSSPAQQIIPGQGGGSGAPSGPTGGSAGGGSGGSGGGAGAPAGAPQPGGTPRTPYVPQGGYGPGLSNKIWGGAVSAVPALQLGANLISEYQSQINKNNFYRSVGGSGGHIEAIGERMGEEWQRVEYGRLFNEQEARQAFKGATALGYNNGSDDMAQNREDAMDFMYQSKEAFGASVPESLQVLSVASRSANTDLMQLKDALDDLSLSAGDAGVNAQQARAQLTELVNTAIQSGFGASSTTVAENRAQAMTMGGRGFQHLDPSGQMSNNSYRYMLAGSMGVSLNQLNTMERTNPTRVNNAASQMGAQTLQSYIEGYDPGLWRWLNNEIKSRSEALQADPSAESEAIATEFWNRAGDLDPVAFQQMASQFYGMQFRSHQDATMHLIRELNGQTAGAVSAQKQANVGKTDLSGKSTARGSKGVAAKKGKQGLINAKDWQGELREHGNGLFGSSAAGATEAYIGQAEKTKSRSGAMEAMLQGLSEDSQKDQKVQVRGPKGSKVVSLEEAIKYYSGQLQSGQAKFVGGEYGGEDIGAFTGGEVDGTARKKAAKEAKQKGKGASVGQSAEEYFKEHPGDKPGGNSKGWKGTRVQIDLSPEASRLLRVSGYAEDADGEPRKPTHRGSGAMGGG